MRNLIVATLAASVTAIITVACSGGPPDLCQDRNVRCEEPLVCDPEDGKCKCGGAGGVECPQGFACNPESNTCISTRCAGVTCGDGLSCDVLDGVCKCGGTGGQVCEDGQICNPATKQCQPAEDCGGVNCGVNEVCDPNDVVCKCGTEVCGPGETCSVNTNNEKSCVPDNCSGVSCLGSTVCDPADGRCKCNGVVCAAGSVCGCPGGAATCDGAERSCQPGSACANVVCQGQTTCDPTDGQCKCGGPGGPVCGPDQICSLTTFTCQGGAQCTLPDGGTKTCPTGTSCDPEDGLCKCGGRGGEVCNDGADGGVPEVCVQHQFSNTCRPSCDLLLQDCAPNTYCYFDTLARIPVAYCAAPTGNKDRGEGCNEATECFTTNPTPKGLFCAGLGTFENPGSTGFCREYCNAFFDPIQACTQQVGKVFECTPIAGDGFQGPPGVGFCREQL